jgi:competence protein ComEC
MPVTELLTGPSVSVAKLQAAQHARSDSNTQADYCRRGQRWQWDGVTFEVLHPGRTTAVSDNESSCVLRIAGEGGSALLTGDIQQLAEAAIVAGGLPHTDIVVVAHHGSRSSSTLEFIAATQAQLAVFSAGYRNRWGFPKPDVVARWQAAGARPLLTIDGGAITIQVDASGIATASEYRRQHRRYWTAR